MGKGLRVVRDREGVQWSEGERGGGGGPEGGWERGGGEKIYCRV